jgi:hypothetical protein
VRGARRPGNGRLRSAVPRAFHRESGSRVCTGVCTSRAFEVSSVTPVQAANAPQSLYSWANPACLRGLQCLQHVQPQGPYGIRTRWPSRAAGTSRGFDSCGLHSSWDLSLVRSQVRPSRPAQPSRFGLATRVRRVMGARREVLGVGARSCRYRRTGAARGWRSGLCERRGSDRGLRRRPSGLSCGRQRDAFTRIATAPFPRGPSDRS